MGLGYLDALRRRRWEKAKNKILGRVSRRLRRLKNG